MSYTVNWTLFALFLILFAENKFKPRIDITTYNDAVLWITWKKKRTPFILFNIPL